MLGLSFNTKSNVPVFTVLKCQNIIYLLFIYPYNIHIKHNVLHNFTAVITLNSTDFTTYLNRAVCFSICLTGCFIMIMNRLYCGGRMLKCVRMRRWSNHWIYSSSNSGSNSSVMKIIGIVHLGLILPSKFDCLFNPSLMDDLTQLMALFVSIIIFAFFLYAWNNIYRLT